MFLELESSKSIILVKDWIIVAFAQSFRQMWENPKNNTQQHFWFVEKITQFQYQKEF